MNDTSKNDWARIDAMSDQDIDTSDISPITDDFFADATLKMPPSSVTVTINIDPKTFAWFQAQGQAGQKQMSAASKIYAQAHQI